MEIDGLHYDLSPAVGLVALQAEWTRLEQRADCPFFLTWGWIGSWLQTTPKLAPLLLSVREGDLTVALALFQPANLRRRFRQRALMLHETGNPADDIITIEYNGILCDRDYADQVSKSVFEFLKRAPLRRAPFGQWDEIHVAMATEAVSAKARDANLVPLKLACKTSWFVDLDALRRSGRPYLETLGRNTRYQIRRSMRLYEERGSINTSTASSAEEAMLYLDELKSLHQSYWIARGRPGCFASRHFEEFHRSLIRNFFPQGTVQLFRVAAGRELIGHLYNFVHRNRVYAYQSGFRYGDDERLKPGLVSHYLCVQQHLANANQIYDFMAGESRYKASLGIRGPNMMHYAFQRRSIASLGENMLRNLKNFIAPNPAR